MHTPPPIPRYATWKVVDTPAGQLTWWEHSGPRGLRRTRARLDGALITIADLERRLAEIARS